MKGLPGKLVFTPFTVADRRNLLAAQAFDDPRAFIRTVVDIVQRNSNLAELDPKLRLHFVEAAFIRIYSASNGGTIDATYTCDAVIEENLDPVPGNDLPTTRVCGETTDIKIPIQDADIDYGPLTADSEQVITLSGDDSFITLEVPGWEDVSAMLDRVVDVKEVNFGDEFVLKCVKNIGGDGKVFTREDFTDEELEQWLNDMDDGDADKVRVFFSNIPILAKTIDISCPACRAKRRLELRGLDSFFG